jgi:hypothetical protein
MGRRLQPIITRVSYQQNITSLCFFCLTSETERIGNTDHSRASCKAERMQYGAESGIREKCPARYNKIKFLLQAEQLITEFVSITSSTITLFRQCSNHSGGVVFTLSGLAICIFIFLECCEVGRLIIGGYNKDKHNKLCRNSCLNAKKQHFLLLHSISWKAALLSEYEAHIQHIC